MEDNNQNKQQKNGLNASVVLSFVVAIFAIVSIAMGGISLLQNNGVSYAAPVVDDTFTLKMGKKVFAYDNPTNMTKAYIMETYYYNQVGIDNAVYCIERNKDVENNDLYKKIATVRDGVADIKNDAGLKFLLGKGTNAESLKNLTEYEDDVDVWVMQSAIWYYLNAKYGSDTDTANVYNLVVGEGVYSYLNDKAIIENNGDVYLSLVDDINATAPGTFKAYSGLTGNNGKIMQLVNAANGYTSDISKVIVSKSSDEFSKTTDGKYYESGVITVTGNPSSNFVRYDLKLTGIDGVVVVDENGDALTLKNIPAGTKFYVRVPADKVTKEVKKIQIEVTGYFNDTTTYYYVESKNTNQRMASLDSGTVSGGTEIEIVGTDNTGMNTFQTIYFIGLIVLLCGVGIVYANAKPVQVKQ